MTLDRLAHGGSNYFDELQERIRRIRNSEYNFYRKAREIFTTSIDYDGNSSEAKIFSRPCKTIFISQFTAIMELQNSSGSCKVGSRDRLNMGFTSCQKRRDTMTLQDAIVAKNYLTEIELKRLDLLVDQFLSYAELQTMEQNPDADDGLGQ